MYDSGKELRKTAQPQNRENSLLDLTGNTLVPEYVCDDCGTRLILFPQAATMFPMERGPHYICPDCHIVTDTSAIKPPGSDEIKPIDTSPPMFSIVPDDKGDNLNIPQPYDPEPGEDQWLKNIGATLIDKKIIVKSDF